jgi:4a-hydroxytetrahydrobiopterin dehydratase
MSSVLMKKDWSTHTRRALTATEIVAKLVDHTGWMLGGDGADLAIQKTFTFANYLDTISFVNAVAFIAQRHDHHPDLRIQYGTCSVRFNTHDVGGLSATDFACATEVDALMAPR